MLNEKQKTKVRRYFPINATDRARNAVDDLIEQTVPGAKLLTRDGEAPFIDPLLYISGRPRSRPAAYRGLFGGFYHLARFQGDRWVEWFAKGTSRTDLEANGFSVHTGSGRKTLAVIMLIAVVGSVWWQLA